MPIGLKCEGTHCYARRAKGQYVPSHNTVKVKKVKCSLYRPGVAQRVGRGIALLFHDRHYKGVCGQQHAPAALYPRERPGTHFTGGWVGSRAGLDGRKISSPPRFDPGPSSP
jgi:hypothetical protein